MGKSGILKVDNVRANRGRGSDEIVLTVVVDAKEFGAA